MAGFFQLGLGGGEFRRGTGEARLDGDGGGFELLDAGAGGVEIAAEGGVLGVDGVEFCGGAAGGVAEGGEGFVAGDSGDLSARGVQFAAEIGDFGGERILAAAGFAELALKGGSGLGVGGGGAGVSGTGEGGLGGSGAGIGLGFGNAGGFEIQLGGGEGVAGALVFALTLVGLAVDLLRRGDTGAQGIQLTESAVAGGEGILKLGVGGGWSIGHGEWGGRD